MQNKIKAVIVIQSILITVLMFSLISVKVFESTEEIKYCVPTDSENKLKTEIIRMEKENQELSNIISDVIVSCNEAISNEHEKQKESLERENEILKKTLNKLRET